MYPTYKISKKEKKMHSCEAAASRPLYEISFFFLGFFIYD